MQSAKRKSDKTMPARQRRATGLVRPSALRPQPSANNPSAFISMELVLALPILAIVLFALIEFSALFFARGTLVDASRAGARAASLAGATPESVEADVRRVLPQGMQQSLRVRSALGAQSGDVVTVAVSIPMQAASPDLLWPIGYSLRGRRLHVETRMIKE